MSSGFSGAAPDVFAAGGRSTGSNFDVNFNPQQQQQQFAIRPPLSGVLPETYAQIRRPDFVGKRSATEFQQNRVGLGYYHRNVKARSNYLHTSPISPLSPVDISPVPSGSTEVSSISNPLVPRYGTSVNRQIPVQRSVENTQNCSGDLVVESEKKVMMMNHRLQELEKVLLGDEEEAEEAISAVSNNDLSDTIQDLLGPVRPPVSPSPTSSSSSCSSTSASPPICAKQSFIDAAATISDGKPEAAVEIITRLQQIANQRGSPEQRLTAYLVSALKSRVNLTSNPFSPSELYSKEQTLAIHMLYDVSPCFKLAFMAANLSILETASDRGFSQIHVLDFDIGQGRQYVHLLHALSSKASAGKRAAALKVTALGDFSSFSEENTRIVGDHLKSLAAKIGVQFNFSVRKFAISDVNLDKLGVLPGETLAVNLAFKLHMLPDESVTTENRRDELLRRVKSLSPAVVTVVEQDINANTAPLTVRVREAYAHYGALFDSLDATASRDNVDRVRIESALGRKLGNSVACEGRDRVERCEVYGKWAARMRMAGFDPVQISQTVADSLRVKLNSGTRGNPGFTVSEQSGGVGFGWMGRILTVASAWR
ncbi:scarecrow-like protein 8 [Andrographis paniculata]|uniref:scarecrow-like protein 8 n=1 Tax=Andrographis paniculata TaxID=175694 RepID=UPI0021E8F3A8|nr:scarecrow-like protein 8 [Andrographis paniculata]